MKTYACNTAIQNSNTTIAKINRKDNNPIKYLNLNNLLEKKAKICNNVCPDIKFANKRIDKLKALDTYEIISTTNKIGIKAVGIPLGINKLKNANFCKKNPKIVKPKKEEAPNVNVTKI